MRRIFYRPQRNEITRYWKCDLMAVKIWQNRWFFIMNSQFFMQNSLRSEIAKKHFWFFYFLSISLLFPYTSVQHYVWTPKYVIFKAVEFFQMSSYDRNFLRTFTIDISAFKRTISRMATTSSCWDRARGHFLPIPGW